MYISCANRRHIFQVDSVIVYTNSKFRATTRPDKLLLAVRAGFHGMEEPLIKIQIKNSSIEDESFGCDLKFRFCFNADGIKDFMGNDLLQTDIVYETERVYLEEILGFDIA